MLARSVCICACVFVCACMCVRAICVRICVYVRNMHIIRENLPLPMVLMGTCSLMIQCLLLLVGLGEAHVCI